MVAQIIIQLIPVIFIGVLAFVVYSLGTAMKYYGTGALGDLSWMLPNTPALNEFFVLVLQVAIVASTLVYALLQVSNHIIISLDIIYFLSLSMLVLYHILKETDIIH